MEAKLKSFLLTGLLFAMLSGLHAQDSAVVEQPKISTPNPKMGGKWQLIPASDSDTVGGHIPEIQIDVKESKFSGNTGCNRMSGIFFAQDSASIQFSDKMITTRMFCSGYNESAFLQNLLRVNNYKFRKGLLIFSVGDIEVFRWKRKSTATKKPTKTPAT